MYILYFSDDQGNAALLCDSHSEVFEALEELDPNKLRLFSVLRVDVLGYTESVRKLFRFKKSSKKKSSNDWEDLIP